LAVNISAMFYLTKETLPHMQPGSAIINTASINADAPNPHPFSLCHEQRCDPEFHRWACPASCREGPSGKFGRAWAGMDAADPVDDAASQVAHFGEQVPMKRPAQPRELAPVYVLLASDEARYISGAMVGGTGGKPIL
jgi:hypothetical protein